MIVGVELEQFLQKKGANNPCPGWVTPKGENWAFYCYDIGLKIDDHGFSCTGQKSKGGNLNPLCEGCPVKGVVFPELTSNNYTQVLYKAPPRS